MINKYRISEKAINDLEKIWLYTLNKWSREQADRYHNLIINEIEYLADNCDLYRRLDYIPFCRFFTILRILPPLLLSRNCKTLKNECRNFFSAH